MDGAWGWYLWNQLMPQNSHHEPFIWHSIISIGALLKSHEVAYSAGVYPHAAVVPRHSETASGFRNGEI